MALEDNAQIQLISDALGQADADLQAELVDTIVSETVFTSNTVAGNIHFVRELVREQTSEDDLDNATSLQGKVRSVELSLSTQLNAVLVSIIRGLETYYLAQTGNKLRTQFAAITTWSTDFRTLWRRVMNEELIVRLGGVAKSGGSWSAFAADDAISLNTALEIRTESTIGAAAITVTITLGRSGGANEVILVSIPALTPSGTTYSLSSNNVTRFNSVVSMSVTGGTNGDTLGVWTV